MRYTRIIEDADGRSRFCDARMKLRDRAVSPALPPVAASAADPALTLSVIAVPAGGEADWHPAPRRQVNIVLAGEVEVAVSDGETRRFGPGSYLLLEDIGGQGHRTRIVSDTEARFAVVALAERDPEP